MALLINNNAVFLHIPKTGGTWFRHALQVNHIPFEELGEQHSHFPFIRELKPEGFFDDKFVFAFVRHPLTWYQSRWAHRVQHGWHVEHPLDYNCASNDFLDFLRRVFEYKPSGWLTYLYSIYIHSVPNGIDFIGRTENLTTDCVEVLRRIGVDFDEDQFRQTPKMNQSSLDGKPSGYWAKYSPEWLHRILGVERGIISQYYADFFIDMESFVR